MLARPKIQIRVADWLIQSLADEGIRHIFMLPGGGAMYLNDAAACEKRIESVACQHEQACGIAAESYGRTGSPNSAKFGVAMVTSGPGSTNIITPVTGAWIDSVPLMIVSGQVKRADRLSGRPIRQGGVQEVDIITMVKSVTKYAVTIEDPQSIRYHFERAIHHMLTGRPGPAWLDIPLDVQAALIHPADLLGFKQDDACINATIDDKVDFYSISRLISSAKRPLILAGHGVRLAGAASDFGKLVEKLEIPAVTTWNALDLLPYDHPLNIGRPGVVATRAANFAVQNCDLLISIGARLDNVVTAYNLKGFARAAKKIIVDIDHNELMNKAEMAIDFPVSMDAKKFINEILKLSIETKTTIWRKTCLDWKLRYPQNENNTYNERGPISHSTFILSLSEALPENTLITTGSSGLAIEFFYAGFRNKKGQRTFLTSGLGSMGYGLPSAIGACLAQNRTPIIAIESDGSLQLNIQELSTIVTYKLPICLFILNNSGYASIRNTQRNYFNGRYIASDEDSGLVLPSFEKLALAYGLDYIELSDCYQLSEKLKHVLQKDRPCIVDIRLISEETLLPKCAAIPQPDGSMLSMPLEDMSPLLSRRKLREEMIIPLHPTSEKIND